MRSRLLTLTSALALAFGGLLLFATPASAAVTPANPAHCSGWNTHPDLYSGGGVSFGDGTYIRSGPYTDCSANGQGFPSQGINVHCAVQNSSGNLWLYVVDTTTGVAGWARYDALHYSKTVVIPGC